MTQIEALGKIEALGQPLFETKDVAPLLGVENSNASKIVSRLAQNGLIIPVRRGKWALRARLNKLAIAEHLTAPYPAYVSLQSALYHHGMVSQIPAVTYVVSLARTRRYQTPVGTFSIHHVAPDFFFGYELDITGRVKIASPEKALADTFYFSPTRTRLFVRLPEIQLPRRFDWAKTLEMAEQIKSPARRRYVKERLLSIRSELRADRAKSPARSWRSVRVRDES
jgi:predicted transcriptional regulator of viral defense system